MVVIVRNSSISELNCHFYRTQLSPTRYKSEKGDFEMYATTRHLLYPNQTVWIIARVNTLSPIHHYVRPLLNNGIERHLYSTKPPTEKWTAVAAPNDAITIKTETRTSLASYLRSPVELRGRDFDCNFNILTQTCFELIENEYTAVRNVDSSEAMREFSVSQHLLMHRKGRPSCIDLYNSMFTSDDDQSAMRYFMERFPIRAGRTSYGLVWRLVQYNPATKMDTYLWTISSALVRVDNNNKPTPLTTELAHGIRSFVDARMDLIKSDVMGTAQNAYGYDMKVLKNLPVASDRKVLYSKTFPLYFTDLDNNMHVNQSVYCKVVQNTLAECIDGMFDNQWWITTMGQIFKQEMKCVVGRNVDKAQSSCVVQILNIDSHDLNEKSVVGVIQQNNVDCCPFRVVLQANQSNKSHL